MNRFSLTITNINNNTINDINIIIRIIISQRPLLRVYASGL